MGKRWRFGAAVALGLTLLVGTWILYVHLYPIPSSWVGTWDNETQLVDAGPGEVRLVISRAGIVDIQCDREKYIWWGRDRLHLHHIRDDIAEMIGAERSMRVRIEVRDGRTTVSVPETLDPPRPDDVMVFRRVQVP